MKIGYARVSTDNQNLARQIDLLGKYGIDEIFTEKISGTITSRPELDKLLLRARDGDTVIVESLSRLGRSTKDLLNLIAYFNEHKIKLVSLKEQIDTQTPTGKLLTTVLMALAEFERDLIVQRTSEGLAAARARGRVGGRPKVNSKAIEKALKLYHSKTHSICEIVNITGISQATLYHKLNETVNE
jgi:DNA invertase Pin-like site-specific DNA recombinase